LQGSWTPLRLREACLKGEIFYTPKAEQIVIEQRRQQYKTVRPHASLGLVPLSAGGS